LTKLKIPVRVKTFRKYNGVKMRQLLSCLGIMLFLTTLSSVNAQDKANREAFVKGYRYGDFTYYTITKEMTGGWAMTGFESRKPSAYPVIRWLTAAHYFPISMKPQVMPITFGDSILYLNELEPIGSDVCVFRLGQDSAYLVKGFSPRGPREDFTAQMDVGLFDEPLDKVFYLVDHRYYNLIGSITIHEPESDIEGSLIDFSSSPGDCGTAFLANGALYVIVKGIPAGLEMPDGRILNNMTVAIRMELHP